MCDSSSFLIPYKLKPRALRRKSEILILKPQENVSIVRRKSEAPPALFRKINPGIRAKLQDEEVPFTDITDEFRRQSVPSVHKCILHWFCFLGKRLKLFFYLNHNRV